MNIIELTNMVVNRHDPGVPLCFDTETIGLYGKIRLAQFYQAGSEDVILVHYPDPYELAVYINKFNIVMHNASYDISTLQDNMGKTTFVPECLEDTMYLARLQFHKQEKMDLASVFSYTLGYDPYTKAGLDKKVLQKSDWDVPVLTEEQLLYAALDVYHLPAVLEACKDVIDEYSYKLDMLTLKHFLGFQCNGFPVIRHNVHAKYKSNLDEIATIGCPINTNSYKQVRPYIDSNNSDGLGLARLTIEGNVRAKEVNTVRKLLKQNSFLKKFETDDSRIYGKFAPSARSGRATCKDQNLEQLPRKTKDCFGYDEGEGRILVYSDFSQLELRGACVVIAERAMEQVFKAGQDLHSYAAIEMFGEDYTKAERHIAKTCNFNLLYGGSANTLGNILIKEAGILLHPAQLVMMKMKWLRLWPDVDKWQKKGIADWRAGKVWSTPLGRKYKAKLMTDQLNIQLQGFGAEVAKLAMHYILTGLKHVGADVKMVNFIHDSYIIDCVDDEEVYKEVSAIVAEAMQDAWKESCKGVAIKDLPIPVSVMAGYNWGGIEDDVYEYILEVN